MESFLRQDHPDKELLILNDTPGQKLVFEHPQVRIFNAQRRFPDLSAKIQYMIDRAAGDVFCRWDDDDLSLPWRLSYSLERLVGSSGGPRTFGLRMASSHGRKTNIRGTPMSWPSGGARRWRQWADGTRWDSGAVKISRSIAY